MGFKMNYTIVIKTLRLNVQLQKSTDQQVGFKMGKNGRQLRYVRVLTKDDIAKPTSLDDVEDMVMYQDTESYFQYRDPETGENDLILVDKAMLKSMYKNTDKMMTVSIIPESSIKPWQFDGSHYFINVYCPRKTKTPSDDDKKMYSIIYSYLLRTSHYMIVSFISSNRQKFAALSADPVSGGLMMSNLIHSTYQRTRETVSNKVDIPDIERYGSKLLEPMTKMGLDNTEICDGYEERAREYIEAIKSVPRSERPKITIKRPAKPVSTVPDLLSLIDGL